MSDNNLPGDTAYHRKDPVSAETESEDDAVDTGLPEDILLSALPDAVSQEEFKISGSYNDTEVSHTNADAIFSEVQGTWAVLSSTEASQNMNAISKLKEEYENVNKLLLDSRKNEVQLVRKCKEMSTEISSTSRKIQTAVKLSQSDRSTITSLQKEVSKAWKQVEINAEKEIRNKDLLASLRAEVDTLRGAANKDNPDAAQHISVTAGLGRHKLLELQMEQEEQLRVMSREKERLENENQRALNEIQTLQMNLEEKETKIQNMQDDKRMQDDDMQTLKDFLATKKSDQDREVMARERLEGILKATSEAAERKEDEVKQKLIETKTLKEQLMKLETQYQSEKFKGEKIEKEKDILFNKVNRLQQEVDDQKIEVQKSQNSQHETSIILEGRENELARLKDLMKQANRAKENQQKRVRILEETKIAVELERDTLRVTAFNSEQQLAFAH